MPTVEHVSHIQKATDIPALQALPQNHVSIDDIECDRYLTSTTTFYSALKHSIKGHCLNATEFRILIRLISHSTGLTSIDLARMLNLTQSTIALSISHLKRLSALECRRDSKDHRAIHMFITIQGIRFVQEIRSLMAPVFERVWCTLPIFYKEYAYKCTVSVGETRGLFSQEYRFRPADIALSDEVFMTTHAASRICAQHDMSLLGFQVLLNLKNHPEGMRPGDLTKALHDRASNITMANKQLLKTHLVRQANDPIDNRASLFEITSDGWKIWSAVNKELANYLVTGLLPSVDQEDVNHHVNLANALLDQAF